MIGNHKILRPARAFDCQRAISRRTYEHDDEKPNKFISGNQVVGIHVAGLSLGHKKCLNMCCSSGHRVPGMSSLYRLIWHSYSFSHGIMILARCSRLHIMDFNCNNTHETQRCHLCPAAYGNFRRTMTVLSLRLHTLSHLPSSQ